MPPVLVLAATNGSGKQEGAIAANVESTNLAAAKVHPPTRSRMHGSIDRLVRSRILVMNCYPLFSLGAQVRYHKIISGSWRLLAPALAH